MAASAAKAKTTSKSTTPAKKSSSSSSADQGAPRLEVRYHKTMKPNRVHALVVGVPKVKKKKGEEAESGGMMVVVRPVIPGALVTPAEQRLELAPGNQAIFHVTALAKGRLPRAHLDVFAPGQAPEVVPLPMKAKTLRLAWALLFLAIAVPMFLVAFTKGSLRPGGTDYSNQADFVEPMTKGLPPIPVFNRPAEFMPEGWQKWTLADTLGQGLFLGYDGLKKGINEYPWIPNTVGVGFLVLAFLAWAFNKPRRKTLRKMLRLKAAPNGGDREAATLEPI